MEEVKDIILNVYSLSVPTTTTGSTTETPSSPAPTASLTGSRNNNRGTAAANTGTNSWTSFLVGKMLPSLGMGAYHTSVRIGTNNDSGPYTTTYTFVAHQGIVLEKRQRSSHNTNNIGVVNALPSHATFKEEIILGSCNCSRGQVNEIIQILSQHYFTNTSYHLVHRNCNHFTETFATALIHYQEFIHPMNTTPKRTVSLSTYPDWINRLANTGANVISHDTDIIPCHPYQEAYHAVTKTTIVDGGRTSAETDPSTSGRWGVFSLGRPGSNANTATSTTSSTSTSKAKQKDEKKELTEAQKKLLEKIRKK